MCKCELQFYFKVINEDRIFSNMKNDLQPKSMIEPRAFDFLNLRKDEAIFFCIWTFFNLNLVSSNAFKLSAIIYQFFRKI